ncbi:lasso peptide biosynthesis B2 protein [Allosphingosinicella indica]|uniref:Transglutaminase-like superfamily protein n=1 Tax=Allosphingosinicella indica TaxID=941907 RepID=A0A1X7FYD7_9SPHN|nr:lasso peptide biosynthesis B2 protein [Allosphingosinicella indica]SMF60995.1 Transglutaminase-like superfamily protein [Allosphingosinicella indica]
MPYPHPTGLAIVDGQAVVLDLAADRYVAIGEPGMSEEALTRALRDQGHLRNGEPLASLQPDIVPPEAEIGEGAGAQCRARMFELLLDQLAIRTALRLGAIARLAAPPAIAVCAERGSLEAEAAAYRDVRRLIPLPPICLADSLAMRRWLARRGIAVALVFGVKLSPFAAHCWLQAGSRVVNDSLDNVRPFTPILAT